MISHDREFLNSLVDSVVEVRFSQLNRYRGNYDDYLVQREANEANQLAAYKSQQKEIAKLMLFVDRFRAKNTKAAQAQSKLKQIERMDKIEAPIEDASGIGFTFPQPQRSGQRVITLEDLKFSYGPTPVYDGLNFEVERGERIVLVGPNGAGKSTLLKLMGGVLQPSGGTRELGHNVRCGYYSQNRVEMLRMDRTVLEEALDTPQRVTEQFVRTLLGCFLFSGDAALKPVKVLSGGEKSRLALVKLLLDPPNFLLMDEPTTHLDMASIEALITALKQFQGTLVFISHDVYFIRQLANFVVHVENGEIRRFAGDYGYYVEKTKQTAPGQSLNRRAVEAPIEKRINPKESRRIEAEERRERSNQRKSQQTLVDSLEKRIATLESRREEIHEDLARPETYQNGAATAELNR
jgi:ATP-binding cassette subfamily F protein 3